MTTRIEPGTLKTYIVGFVLCIVLTVLAYLVIVEEWIPRFSTAVIVLLGLLQLLVQLFCFLHLGEEEKPYPNLLLFVCMLFILAVIILGSLWIMHNLDYRVM